MKTELVESLEGLFIILLVFILPLSIFWLLWVFLLPVTFWQKVVWIIISSFISLFFEVVYFAILGAID